jgi:hypothetical protein
MIELLHVMSVTKDACYMGLITYRMNHFHDVCYVGHETYDMNHCHFIWYGITYGLYFMTHWGCIYLCIYAYVCHMTHGIKGWQKFKFTYSNKPIYHFLSTMNPNYGSLGIFFPMMVFLEVWGCRQSFLTLNGLISYCWSESFTSLSRIFFCFNLHHNLCYKRVWGLSHLMIFNSKKENCCCCKVFANVILSRFSF